MHQILLLSAALLMACSTTSASTEANMTSEARPDEVMNSASPQDQPMTPAEMKAKAFLDWKRDFSARAIAQGYSSELVAQTIGRAQYYERTIDRDTNQPEFTRSIWSYIDGAASADRITQGRAEKAEHAQTIDAIENQYGVSGDTLVAIWGLESAYGRIMGNFDLFDTLATLAFDGRRRDFAEQQMLAALDLIRAGHIRPDQTKSAWAGAMGMTQFIPTTFRDFAVDFDGDGNKNLWESEADALASAANYLERSGWNRGEPVLVEVAVPTNFDYSVAETSRRAVGEWATIGVNPMSGQWSPDLTALEARLLVPAGHTGPKLLAFENFNALMKYNRSTSYVMGITSLAHALDGQRLLTTPWPEDDQPLSFDDKKAMQAKLTELGFDTQGVDGQIGPNSRRAIRDWQKARGLPADGYIEQSLFARLMAE